MERAGRPKSARYIRRAAPYMEVVGALRRLRARTSW